MEKMEDRDTNCFTLNDDKCKIDKFCVIDPK